MRLLYSIFLLTALFVSLAVGCSSKERHESKNAERSNTEWAYEVISFRNEITARNGYGSPMKFNVASAQFDETVFYIENNSWEYVGVVHSANELANNVTYVLFRKPK